MRARNGNHFSQRALDVRKLGHDLFHIIFYRIANGKVWSPR